MTIKTLDMESVVREKAVEVINRCWVGAKKTGTKRARRALSLRMSIEQPKSVVKSVKIKIFVSRSSSGNLRLAKRFFSVNDGPLRGTGSDPADEAFLHAIREERRCPDELEMLCAGKEPVVDLVDKTSEEYKAPPKPKYVAFSGGGMSLGGGERVTIDPSAPVQEVTYNFVLDESAKMTKLQLNFHDGSKIAQKFNLTHTVQDIRMFMESQKPMPFGTTFELRTAYDKTLLDNPSLTIADGKLKGESLMQTLT